MQEACTCVLQIPTQALPCSGSYYAAFGSFAIMGIISAKANSKFKSQNLKGLFPLNLNSLQSF